ncbi:hypothetical protein D621_15370 [beta proteobacterium AAP51]|nr:hypothetical protein D621_15370 [beta proteobacterium AAP51]
MSWRALLPAMVWGLLWAAPGQAWAEEPGGTWAQLSTAQQQALAPLQRDWARIEGPQRQKWLELAARYPQLPADERQRLQARMAEWARMTPAQRAKARQQFQEVRRVPDEARQAHWQAYQSLSAEERERLAQRPKPSGNAARSQRLAQDQADGGDESAKRNIVGAPARSVPRAVNPGVQQAGPGATTKPVTARAAPPLHHQTGLPKIAATPHFVDPQTLLPQKGPQGAAVRSAAPASAAEKSPAQ